MVTEAPAPPLRADAGSQPQLLAEYDNMLSCVRCGLCLTSCPTYVLSLQEPEGPRGRIGMLRALAEGHLRVTPDLVEHELSCLVCDACTAVCPAGVHMDPLQVAARGELEVHARRSWLQRAVRGLVFGRLFPNMPAFRSLARLLWLYQRSGLAWLARRLGILGGLGLARTEAFLPRISTRFLLPRGEVYPSENPAVPAERVSFFAGCIMSTALADVDRATIRVLRRAGCEVANTAAQGCCGALNAHGGDLERARAMARGNIQAFESDGETPIVVNAAGCGAMLKDYAHLLRDDPAWAQRARRFSARVRDVTEYLAARELPMRRAVNAKVAYQDACHLLNAQRISQPPRTLLRAVPGLELAELPEPTLCCGSAGVYNLTHPDAARALQQRKVEHALKLEPDIVATANPGCLLQIRAGLNERGTPIRVKHVVELLDEASRP